MRRDGTSNGGCLVCAYVIAAIFWTAFLNVLFSYTFVRERLGEKEGHTGSKSESSHFTIKLWVCL